MNGSLLPAAFPPSLAAVISARQSSSAPLLERR